MCHLSPKKEKIKPKENKTYELTEKFKYFVG